MDERHEGSSSPKAGGHEIIEILEESQIASRGDAMPPINGESVPVRATEEVIPAISSTPDAAWVRNIRDKMLASQPCWENMKMKNGQPRWENMKMRNSACICRVPVRLRNQLPNYYQPKVVSIGPYHWSNSELRINDENKWWCVKVLASKHSLDVEEWLHRMSLREEEARACYSDDELMDNQSFLELLLLDGCFLSVALELVDVARSVGWPMDQIKLDMLMLENQVPFFVLVELCKGIYNDYEIISKVSCFFCYNFLMIVRSNCDFHPKRILHLLHLFRWSLSYMDDDENEVRGGSFPKVPSATKLLNQSCMKFKTNFDPKGLLDIRFHSGVMEIPTLPISDDSKIVLHNLIPFEQCSLSVTPYVATYAAFMNRLLNRENDVNLLEEHGILLNMLPTSKDVLFFFKKLSPKVSLGRSSTYLDTTAKKVEKYHTSRWRRWYSDLKLNYFSNPWVTLPVIATAFLLILSLMQTCYSVLGYYYK